MYEIVPPSGDPDFARYIIVGTCPGKADLLKGEPLVGSAGRVLDRLLASAKIGRHECYILNAVGEEPPGKDIKNMITTEKLSKAAAAKRIHVPGSTTGAYVTKEFLDWQTLLLDRINKCDAQIVIPLGAVAMFACTGKNGILNWRGSLIYDERLPGKTIIPTIHPDMTFQAPLFEYHLLHDLERAQQECYRPQGIPKRKYRTQTGFAEAMWYLEECNKHGRVGFDIETKRTKKTEDFQDWEMSCFSLASSRDDCICIQLVDNRGDNYFSLQQEREILQALFKLLANPNVIKVGHNIIFDLSFIFKKYGVTGWPVDDTMIASGILMPDFKKKLDDLTSIYSLEPYYKADGGKQHTGFGVSLEKFVLYSAKDAVVLLDIWEQQEQELKEQGNWETYCLQRDMIQPLLFMGALGIKCNKETRLMAAQALEREIEEREMQLWRMAGKQLNSNSSKQMQAYFYDEKGLIAYKNRKTGSITCDETAMKKIAAKGYDEAILILKIRELIKLKSTYMEMTLDLDDRIRSSFNPVGTKTGRLSSSKTIFNTGGNIQNLPPAYKKYLIADTGYYMINCDLSQAENRIVANIAPDFSMLEAFETGVDVHSLTGSKLCDLSPQEVKEQYDKWEKSGENKEFCAQIGNCNKPWRFWGKQANHALNYGLGPNKFAERLEIPVADAKMIIEKYHRGYPGVHEYHAWIQNDLRKNNMTLVNCMGRKRRFFGRWGPDLFQEAYAQIPQSTVADIINSRGILPMYRDKAVFGSAELLDQVHDSIVFQVPVECGWLTGAVMLLSLQKLLVQPVSWRLKEFTIPADFQMGLNMGKMSKIKVKGGVDEIAAEMEKVYAGLC